MASIGNIVRRAQYSGREGMDPQMQMILAILAGMQGAGQLTAGIGDWLLKSEEAGRRGQRFEWEKGREKREARQRTIEDLAYQLAQQGAKPGQPVDPRVQEMALQIQAAQKQSERVIAEAKKMERQREQIDNPVEYGRMANTRFKKIYTDITTAQLAEGIDPQVAQQLALDQLKSDIDVYFSAASSVQPTWSKDPKGMVKFANQITFEPAREIMYNVGILGRPEKGDISMEGLKNALGDPDKPLIAKAGIASLLSVSGKPKQEIVKQREVAALGQQVAQAAQTGVASPQLQHSLEAVQQAPFLKEEGGAVYMVPKGMKYAKGGKGYFENMPNRKFQLWEVSPEQERRVKALWAAGVPPPSFETGIDTPTVGGKVLGQAFTRPGEPTGTMEQLVEGGLKIGEYTGALGGMKQPRLKIPYVQALPPDQPWGGKIFEPEAETAYKVLMHNYLQQSNNLPIP